jgi:DsbC/DsbD-like thiol-disulfide interchange protein
MKIASLVFGIALVSAPALQAGDAFEVPVSAEFLQGWVQPDGTRMAAVHLKLEPGWKTYWRAPGDAGIPPSFNWSGSRNLGAISVSWPTPKVFDQNGMRSIGYTNEVVIPLAISPLEKSEPVALELKMDIGICSDICVPHQVALAQILDTGTSKPTAKIAAAIAERPHSASEGGVTSAICNFEPTADGIRIEARVAMPSAGGTEVVVIEPGNAEIWVSEAETHRAGGALIARSDLVHVGGGQISLDRSRIRLTVLGASHAVDIQGCSAG